MYDYTEIKYLQKFEKEALFQAIEETNCKYQIRNQAIFFIAEYAALRASEVGMIRISDINFDRKEIYFRRLKGSRNNTLRILEKRVWDSLINYMSYRRQNDIYSEYLFISQMKQPISRKTLHELMRHYSEIAQLPKEKSHFHVLKHTRAVYLADLGLDTKEIQYWTGHKNIANTEVYLQFTTTQQETLYHKIYTLIEAKKNKKKECLSKH